MFNINYIVYIRSSHTMQPPFALYFFYSAHSYYFLQLHISLLTILITLRTVHSSTSSISSPQVRGRTQIYATNNTSQRVSRAAKPEVCQELQQLPNQAFMQTLRCRTLSSVIVAAIHPFDYGSWQNEFRVDKQ